MLAQRYWETPHPCCRRHVCLSYLLAPRGHASCRPCFPQCFGSRPRGWQEEVFGQGDLSKALEAPLPA